MPSQHRTSHTFGRALQPSHRFPKTGNIFVLLCCPRERPLRRGLSGSQWQEAARTQKRDPYGIGRCLIKNQTNRGGKRREEKRDIYLDGTYRRHYRKHAFPFQGTFPPDKMRYSHAVIPQARTLAFSLVKNKYPRLVREITLEVSSAIVSNISMLLPTKDIITLSGHQFR